MKITSAWPNEAQLILLKAALLSPDEAEPYWHEFVAAYDLQELDHGCNQLLPMVFINLKGRLKNDVNERTCRSSYKYAWANNHMLMHDAKALLVLLKQHDLKVCLLKGAAFIGHYFPDYGMRIMGDIDLLISPEQMPELIRVLESNGYKICANQQVDSQSLLRLFHARSFKNERGTDFDVHQYLSSFLINEQFTTRLWQNVNSVEFFGIKHLAYVLNPTYQFLHTVLHGLQYAPESSIRWIVDVINLVKNRGEEINWEEVIAVCTKHHLNLPVKMALNFLKQEMNLPIPRPVLSHFNSVKITRKDNEYFVCSSNLGVHYTLLRIKRSWEHYKLYSSNSSKNTGMIGFYDFLSVYLNVESRWMLIPHIVKKSVGVVWRAVMSQARRLRSEEVAGKV